MGREVRSVPAGWEHPKTKEGHYIPLHGNSFAERVRLWDIEKDLWDRGLIWQWFKGIETVIQKPADYTGSYEEWDGSRPEEKDYMPDWPEAERTHWQMYEDTTEGTPISPVMADPETLAHWLADSGASAFGGSTASYESWLATIRRGSAVSAYFSTSTGLISGVEAQAEMDRQK